MTDALSPHLDHLPLFPLPGAALFPRMTMPLHIFEPRYRTMVQQARSDHLPIAIGMIEPGKKNHDTPAVYAIAGVGFIEKQQMLPDGRSLIELVGVSRVRILAEKETTLPYRVVRAQRLEDTPCDPKAASRAISTLKSVLFSLQTKQPEAAGAFAQAMASQKEVGAIADALAAVIQTDPLVQQEWLEQCDPIARLNAITEMLGAFLAQSHPGTSTLN